MYRTPFPYLLSNTLPFQHRIYTPVPTRPENTPTFLVLVEDTGSLTLVILEASKLVQPGLSCSNDKWWRPWWRLSSLSSCSIGHLLSGEYAAASWVSQLGRLSHLVCRVNQTQLNWAGLGEYPCTVPKWAAPRSADFTVKLAGAAGKKLDIFVYI